MDIDRQDPYLDQGMRGFIHKFARKNYWRVASWMDFDDLIQDGFLCYYKCRRRYVKMDKPDPSKDDRKHMMSLVMTTFARHMMTFNHNTYQAFEKSFSEFENSDGSSSVLTAIPAERDIGTSAIALLAEAPREVVDLFRILVGDAATALPSIKRSRVRRQVEPLHWVIVRGVAICCGGSTRVRMGRRALRETTNEFYCRLLGLDPREHDVRGMVREYLND